jgi:hypothetical protein
VNGGVDEWAATEDSSVGRSVTGVLATSSETAFCEGPSEETLMCNVARWVVSESVGSPQVLLISEGDDVGGMLAEKC